MILSFLYLWQMKILGFDFENLFSIKLFTFNKMSFKLLSKFDLRINYILQKKYKIICLEFIKTSFL